MLIEAVIEKGQVRLLQPMQFVHDYFAVKVEIPEDEIAQSNLENAQQFRGYEGELSTSSSLIKQIWAARKHDPSEEQDLLEGIEKKYE